MELTRKEILELNGVLATTNYDMPISSRFRYMVSKNLSATKVEIDEINAAFPPPAAMAEYQKLRGGIFQKYKIKNDKEYGEMPEEPKKSLDGELEVLNKKFETLLKEIEETNKEKESFLDETVDLPLIKVKLEFVPNISQNNKFNGWDIWQSLMKVIDDE